MPKGNGNSGKKASKVAKGTAKPARGKGLPKAEKNTTQRKGENGTGGRGLNTGLPIRA